MDDFCIKFKVFDNLKNKWIDFNDWKRHDIEFNFDPTTNEIVCEYDKSRFEIYQYPYTKK